MPSFRTGTVVDLLSERPGLQRVRVDLGSNEPEQAYVLTQLIGRVDRGDRVVVNTTAVELGLGTGGWHVVHWNLDQVELQLPGDGHVVKMRYTSLQADTGVVEEHSGFEPGSVTGVPVVACALHSQLAGVAVVVHHLLPEARVVYVMNDTAALPIAVSELVAELRDARLLAATVTAGQAFGGDFEAVNVASALTVATGAAFADVIVVAPGPGVLGTGTPLGFGSLDVAATLDAAARLGGVPIAALRWSDADQRERHRGLSHHSRTALAWVERTEVLAAVTEDLDLVLPGFPGEIRRVAVPDVAALLAERHLQVSTMGRGPAEEPTFFQLAGAAGALAASECGGTATLGG